MGGQWLHVTFTHVVQFTLMLGLIVVVIVLGLIMAVPFFGADSRDGRDWRPLCLASPLPDTDVSVLQRTRLLRVVALVAKSPARLVRGVEYRRALAKSRTRTTTQRNGPS